MVTGVPPATEPQSGEIALTATGADTPLSKEMGPASVLPPPSRAPPSPVPPSSGWVGMICTGGPASPPPGLRLQAASATDTRSREPKTTSHRGESSMRMPQPPPPPDRDSV